MIRRSRLKNKIGAIVLIIGLTVAYNEFIAYEIQRLHWAFHKCTDCTRILLVADPQILGIKNENYPGASVAIWDSDSYLRKTFARALAHSQPHVIAFLGDLMDEGHIASGEYFEKYKRRFDSIFQTPDDVMKIYLPGDNDVGGEEDTVSAHISDRFEFTYSQPDTLSYKSVNFFKVNRLTHSVPGAPSDAFLNDYSERNTTNVVLSHMPLLFSPGSFVQSVVKELSPQLIFSAHDHKAMHTSLDMATNQLSDIWILPPHENRLFHLRLDMGDIHEVQIPTCSYRMGTPYIGYGLASVDTHEKLVQFTILWQPNRFVQILVYNLVGLILIIFSFYFAAVWAYRVLSGYVTYTKVPNMRT
ncbi:uncharacterized protein C630.12 [Neodiprion lecontei]|uniref:Uncharacterized protein C630.12 n=1 Tax=Neodiprion lecontei TaxID=441921 RepID=A0A6J0CBX1_NEOLC|nr:uncharacterized protein C630.12 [Neodiprion lecontei]